jgi:Ala-tRNA(Pro) deacylase
MSDVPGTAGKTPMLRGEGEPFASSPPRGPAVRLIHSHSHAACPTSQQGAERGARNKEDAMTVVARVKRHLDEAKAPFEVVTHPETFTAKGTAAAAHVSGWKMAKVLVARDDAGFVMALVPASCHLDLAAFRDVTGRRHLEMAKERELLELFPDCEVGAMPPLGRLYAMPVYADRCFADDEEFLFPAGNHREVVKMAWRDFARVAQPVLMHFCRP